MEPRMFRIDADDTLVIDDIELEAFVALNLDDPNLRPALEALAVGASTVYGGGAAAQFTITRIA